MKKKLLCLLLAIITISSLVLVSCSNDEVYIPSAEVETRTLSMYLMTDYEIYSSSVLNNVKAYLKGEDANTSEAKAWITANVKNGVDAKTFVDEQLAIAKQYEAVVEQINVITKRQFSIQLNITFIAKDKYYDTLYKSLNTANAGDFTGYIKKAEVYENEYGVPVYQYPEVPSNHVDIFYVDDVDFFNKILEEKLVSSLTEELNGAQKIMKTVVYPSYFKAVTKDSNTYGVPFNIPAGDYKCILVNKELADKYSLSIESVSTWKDLASFLSIVDKYETSYAPIKANSELSSMEEVLSEYMLNTFFWSVVKDGEEYKLTDDFSIIGTNYDKDATQNGENTTKYNVSNVLASTESQSQISSLTYYFNKGYFETTETKKSAVELFEGNIAEINARSDEYYSIIIDVPHITEEESVNGMFAVSGNTTSVAKSLQIITYIFRNADLRNLFAYGIEEENYVKDNDGLVEVLENSLYKSDLERTGNILNAYATNKDYATIDDEGNIVDAFGLAKTHDSETLVDPMFGFDLNKVITENEEIAKYGFDYANIEGLKATTDDFISQLEGLDKNTSIEDIAKFVSTFASNVTRNDKNYEKARMNDYSLKNEKLAIENGTSIAEVYLKWLEQNGLTTFDN